MKADIPMISLSWVSIVVIKNSHPFGCELPFYKNLEPTQQYISGCMTNTSILGKRRSICLNLFASYEISTEQTILYTTFFKVSGKCCNDGRSLLLLTKRVNVTKPFVKLHKIDIRIHQHEIKYLHFNFYNVIYVMPCRSLPDNRFYYSLSLPRYPISFPFWH